MQHEQTLPSNPVEITKDLRDMFTPLCMATAEAALPDNVAVNDPEIRKQVETAPVHVLPTDFDFGSLPWDLLLGKDLQDLTEAKAAIKTAALIDPLDADFSSLITIENDIVGSWLERHPEEKRGGTDLRVYIEQTITDTNSSFDIDSWKQYEQYMGNLPANERAHIDQLQSSRTFNVNKGAWFIPEMRQVDTLLHTHNETIGAAPALLGELAMPVGEYGESFATELLRATATMQSVAEKHVRAQAAKMTIGNEPMLATYTARGADLDEASDESTMNSLQEGILSIGQSLAIVTMEKVAGYDDPHALAQDIVKAGLIGRLARYAPMGFVGPMALSGRYLPGSLVKTESGVGFSDQFERYLKERKAEYFDLQLGRAATTDMQSQGHYKSLMTICPVANVGGGVDIMANTYVDLLKNV